MHQFHPFNGTFYFADPSDLSSCLIWYGKHFYETDKLTYTIFKYNTQQKNFKLTIIFTWYRQKYDYFYFLYDPTIKLKLFELKLL